MDDEWVVWGGAGLVLWAWLQGSEASGYFLDKEGSPDIPKTSPRWPCWSDESWHPRTWGKRGTELYLLQPGASDRGDIVSSDEGSEVKTAVQLLGQTTDKAIRASFQTFESVITGDRPAIVYSRGIDLHVGDLLSVDFKPSSVLVIAEDGKDLPGF